jgi:GNAT superfamily N-acetyltransferase
MIFRDAIETDLKIVAGFPQNAEELFYIHPSASYPLTANQLLQNFRSRKGNTVALKGKKVVGFANFINVIESESAAIGNMIIDPLERGSGIGSELIEYMSQMASATYMVKNIIIPCFSSNIKGLLFYHKLGFSPIKGEPRTDPNGLPAYLIYLNRKN